MSLARYKPILITMCIAALGQVIHAQTGSPTALSQVQIFGMVGVTAHQTIRLNILNPGVLTPSIQPVACSAQLLFVSSQGTVLKMTSATVAPGRSYSFDLGRDTDSNVDDGRLELRAVVRSVPVLVTQSGSGQLSPPFCPLIPTLEVFDNDTGKTLVILTEPRSYPAIPGIISGGTF